jgi:hypothetical protein
MVVSDPGTGAYMRWLDGGTYTVTVSAVDHLTDSQVVQVTAQQTTTLDVALRWIESCMDVTPASFNVEVPVNTVVTETLSLINDGAGELLWELHETTATVKLVDQDITVTIPATRDFDEDVASRSPAIVYPQRQFTMHINAISAEMIDVLIVTPDVVGGGDISLILTTLAAFPDLNVVVWDGNAGTPSVADMQAYDVVFVGNDILWSSSAIDKLALSNNLADFVDAGGKVLVGSFIWSYDDWGFGGGRFITEDYTPFEISTTDIWDPTTLGDFDPAHPIMDGITSVTDNFNHQDPQFSSNGEWVASWADGEYFVGVSPNVVGLNQEYFHTADFGAQTGELLHNALLFLGAQSVWVDVPWVTEVPTTGVTLPDSTFDVDMVFDSTGLTEGECYTASLGIVHDDPGWESPVMIPLELCVVELVYGVDVSGDMEATGLPGDTITYTLTVTNLGNTADTFDLALGSFVFPTSLSTSVIGPLGPGAAAIVDVIVEIPAESLPGDYDAVTVSATSQTDPTATDGSVLTTTVVGSFDVDLEPEASAMTGVPAQTLTYTLQLTNTGDIADTYELTVSGVYTDWVVVLPVTTFDLAGQETVEVLVVVTIPTAAADGDFDTIIVTATSTKDEAVMDAVEITTTVEVAVPTLYLTFLPVTYK